MVEHWQVHSDCTFLVNKSVHPNNGLHLSLRFVLKSLCSVMSQMVPSALTRHFTRWFAMQLVTFRNSKESGHSISRCHACAQHSSTHVQAPSEFKGNAKHVCSVHFPNTRTATKIPNYYIICYKISPSGSLSGDPKKTVIEVSTMNWKKLGDLAFLWLQLWQLWASSLCFHLAPTFCYTE